MNWTPFLAIWICLGAVTLGLALYRKFLSMKEDDYIHVEDWKTTDVEKQEVTARRFHAIDRWGETLTIVTVATGLLLAITYLYVAFSRT